MMDYISRQAAIDALRKNQEICKNSDAFNNDVLDNYTLSIIDIDIVTVAQLSSAPVREVKRGRWVEHKDYPGLAYLCSECNLFTTDRSYYCPKCGADNRENSE